MKLLHVDSSILGQGSVSRTLSGEIVAALRTTYPAIEVVYRDLATDPVGHLTGAHLAALQGVSPADPAIERDISAGQAALDEFLAADIVVVGAPVYNFAVPSQLKAWIDRLAVAGKTFRYTEKGPEGLAGSKRLIVASSRGGVFGPGSPAASLDHQETYLRALFGFLGVKDISFVRAEGVAMGPKAREDVVAAAKGEVAKLVA
jgi:FMN-dependent NADH-azoreductase